MKKITITANHIVLVFKNGILKRVLNEGTHWLGFGEKPELYDRSKPFYSTVAPEVLLQHKGFAEAVSVVEVADNELALVYEHNNFKSVLNPGKHLFWKGLIPQRFLKVDTGRILIDETVDRNLLEKAPLAAFVRNVKVEAYEQALLFIDGRYTETLAPGNYSWWKNNTQLHVAKTDMRQLTMEINGQEILTRDKAQLRINFMVQYKVADIVKALFDNKEFEKQLYIVMQLGLRECVGRMTLDELMESKEQIADTVLEAARTKAAELGITLLGCGVKDIILPGDVREIMNQVLIAEKKAQANIITRREETASTRSLLNTARLMEENTMLFKLKEMEYVEKIAERINNISLSGGGQIVDQLKQLFIKS